LGDKVVVTEEVIMKRELLFAGCVTVLVASVAGSAPVAQAGTSGLRSGTLSAPLNFTGYDPARAAANGYEVRIDEDGLQFAVPAGTPSDSEVGATPKFDPSTGRVTQSGSGGDTASKTVPGNCGTATFDFTSNTTFYTAYDLNGAFGASLGHTWHVAIQSRIDAGSYDLGGLPPAPGASLHWEDTHAWDEVADRNTVVSGVAGGTVVTVLGSCESGQPADSWTYQ
jgi:hypothetical protein